MAMQGPVYPNEPQPLDPAEQVTREMDTMRKIIALLAPFDQPDRARMLQYVFAKVVVSPLIRQQMVEQYEATRRVPNPDLTGGQ